MKIAMLVLNDMTADARVDREARSLAAAGHVVEVFALRRPHLPEREDVGSYVIHRVADFTRAGLRQPLKKLRERRVRERSIAAHAVAAAPDVVHCHDTDTLAAGYRAARDVGARLIYDAHELFPDMLAGHGRGSWLVQRYWRRLERRLVPRADLVITVSEPIAGMLATRYGVSAVTVRNTHVVEPLGSRGELRRQIDVGDDVPLVLYQGGLIGGRALHRLVAAMALVPDATLVIEGSGPEGERLRDVARERGCEDRVRFMGWVPPSELHSHACGADIGVVIYENTSLNNYYAAPNKLYAYMMAGLPMVASDFPGLRDVVLGEGVGSVFDPADEESIARALRLLLEDQTGRSRMAERAREVALSRYNWSVDSARLLDAYDRLGV